MPIEPKPLSNLDRYVRLGLYGEPGTRKTSFAAMAPKPVILDYENSSEALRETYPNIDVVEKANLKDIDAVSKFIKAIPDSEWETLIIDTMSSAEEIYMKEHLRKVTNSGNKRSAELALFQDFRMQHNVMASFFHALTEVPCNVIVVMHQREWEAKDDKGQPTGRITQIRPSMSPANIKTVSQLLNEVFYFEKQKNPQTKGFDSIVTVDSQGKILAKNRQHLPEAKYTNPNWKDIYSWN